MSDEIARSTNPISLTRFLLAERSQFKEATGSFAMLLQSIALACKVISNATRKANLSSNVLGIAAGQSQNTSGDQQKKLDVSETDNYIRRTSNEERTLSMGTNGEFGLMQIASIHSLCCWVNLPFSPRCLRGLFVCRFLPTTS